MLVHAEHNRDNIVVRNAVLPSIRSAVAPFVVMDVMEAAARAEANGIHVLHLEVGQPSTPAPASALAAASDALHTERLGYTVAVGIPQLRSAISRHYADVYGLEIPSDRIICTPGASGGFVLAYLAAFEAGARVAVAAPGYPCYRNILKALGVEPVLVPCGPQTRYQITPELLGKLDGPIHGVTVASPSNPTGTAVVRREMSELVAYCCERGMTLISDEIYHGLEFGERAATAAAFGENAIVVNSFSKYFSMTGWRIGWMVVPEDLVRPIEKLAQNLFIAASSLSQIAAVAAFDGKQELEEHVLRYAKNRNVILEALPRMGITRVAPPDGAFYVYAEVGHITNDSKRFCTDLLNATGVAITPGVDFDPARGHQSIRFSYAGSTQDVVEAMRRMDSYLRTPMR
jgi:aspartate/methionine/tyrosine aminotransferase